jgi:hypothetical protein
LTEQNLIEVRGDGVGFGVTVKDGKGATRHRVTISEEMLHRIGGARPAEQVVRACFLFLLERESKEAILRRFDVAVIAGYFPEFDRNIGKYLDG